MNWSGMCFIARDSVSPLEVLWRFYMLGERCVGPGGVGGFLNRVNES